MHCVQRYAITYGAVRIQSTLVKVFLQNAFRCNIGEVKPIDNFSGATFNLWYLDPLAVAPCIFAARLFTLEFVCGAVGIGLEMTVARSLSI